MVAGWASAKRAKMASKKAKMVAVWWLFFLSNHQAKENCSIFLFAYWYFFSLKKL